MRILHLLPLLAVAHSFVIPDQETFNSVPVEDHDVPWEHLEEVLPCHKHGWKLGHSLEKLVDHIKHKVNLIFDINFDNGVIYDDNFETAFAGEAWMESAEYDLDLVNEPPPDGPPHHGPPHHGPPGKKRPPPHRGPGKRPHRKPHRPHKSNLTVYELIAKSKYTTTLAKLINEYPDLVELLNGTSHNFTVFAPTNKAFKKLPKKAHPSKEMIEKVLMYHASPEFFPAGRIFFSRTIPTALTATAIGKDVPQRLSTQIGFKGLTLNFYSKIVAANIFGSNGVIHGIDSLLFPPPKAASILSALPGYFSTLDLALWKTGLFKDINDTSTHEGGTLFAPTNMAFKKLGPKINAFLFSKYGQKYLAALLEYHMCPNITLYSDAIYKAELQKMDVEDAKPPGRPGPPKGVYHVDLPTALKGKSLSIDIARYGRMISMKINAFTNVAVLDGIAADGVIHVVPNVLIPPKAPGMPETTGEIELEDLIDRLAPFVKDHDDDEVQNALLEILSDVKEIEDEIEIEL